MLRAPLLPLWKTFWSLLCSLLLFYGSAVFSSSSEPGETRRMLLPQCVERSFDLILRGKLFTAVSQATVCLSVLSVSGLGFPHALLLSH